MGTRGLIGFIINGVRRGAYNHWDSHPSGMGNDVVAFILSLTDVDMKDMQAKVEKLVWVAETPEHWTGNNRDLLDRVKAGQNKIVDSTGFLQDTLWCEYAYFVDFDKRLVELHCYGHCAQWTFEALAPDVFEGIYKILEQRAKERWHTTQK